jgi:hypothetical protein
MHDKDGAMIGEDEGEMIERFNRMCSRDKREFSMKTIKCVDINPAL